MVPDDIANNLVYRFTDSFFMLIFHKLNTCILFYKVRIILYIRGPQPLNHGPVPSVAY